MKKDLSLASRLLIVISSTFWDNPSLHRLKSCSQGAFFCTSFFLTLVISSGDLAAQISESGEPFSYGMQGRMAAGLHLKIKKAKYSRLVNNTKEKEQAERENDHEAYGIGVSVDIDLKRDGDMFEMPGGGKLWLLKAGSQGAYGLQLHFNKFKIPEGAKLFIYNKERSMKLGAYTSENNNEDNTFCIQIIKGDSLIVEYYEPKTAVFRGELKINKLIHVFKPVFSGEERSGAQFNTAGRCNINAACEPIYEQERKAISKISLYDPVRNRSGFASGALINSMSHAPYLLTARHIYKSSMTANQYFSTFIFYFNYEFSSCSGSTIEPALKTLQGAYLRSVGDLSDYMLLELAHNPKNYYSVSYLGWDAVDFIPNSAVGIHHPSADVMKISLLYTSTPLTVKTEASTDPFEDTFEEVSGYPKTDLKFLWDEGITEGGSSGSPLLDMTSRKIVGQLRGGTSICSGSSVYYPGPDWYGRFCISFNGARSGFPSMRTVLTGSDFGPTSMYGDYNGNGDPAYVVISDISLTTHAFELPKNRLIPTVQTFGNTGELSYSWSPSSDFTHPTLKEGVITFKNSPPTLPITKTYTLTVTPEKGLPTQRSVRITLYDCENKNFSINTCLDSDVQLGRPGMTAESYSWSPASDLSAANIANPVFRTSVSGVYRYTLTAVSAGCTRKENYDIYVEDVSLAKPFTPTIQKQIVFGKPGASTFFDAMYKTTDGGFMIASFADDGRFIKLDANLNVVNEITKPWVDDGTLVGRDRTVQSHIVPTSDGGYVLAGLHNDVSTMAKYSASNLLEWKKNTGPRYYANFIQASDGSYLFASHGGAYDNFMCLKKYSATLDFVWTKCYSSLSAGLGELVETSDGGFLMSGYSDVVKVDRDGVFQWHKTLNVLIINALCVDGENVLIGCTVDSENDHNSAYLVLKVTNNGDVLWERKFDGAPAPDTFDAIDALRSIAKTSDGGYLLAGISYSNAGVHKSENRKGQSDYWMVKIDENGNKAGDKTYGGSADESGLVSVFESAPEQYVLAGTSKSGVSGDKTKSLIGSSDIWILQVGRNGYVSPGEKTEICQNFPAGFDNSSAPVKNIIVALGTTVFPDATCPNLLTVEAGAKLYVRATNRIVMRNTRIQRNAVFSGKVDVINFQPCNENSGRKNFSFYETSPVTVENESYSNLQVYPNVTSDIINVQCKFKNIGGASITVCSVLRELFSEQIETSNVVNRSFDLSQYPSGVYFVTIQSSEGTVCKKVILSK